MEIEDNQHGLSDSGRRACAGRGPGIQGQVGSIGYPFGRSARSAVREGQWFPIRVELRATSGEQAGVEVELRAQSVDLDGDRVDFVKPDVTLTVGDIERPFWCYAVAYRGGPSMFEELRVPTELEIVDPARRMTLGTFSVPPVDVVENDAVLVLDVSAGRSLICTRCPARSIWGSKAGVSASSTASSTSPR